MRRISRRKFVVGAAASISLAAVGISQHNSKNVPYHGQIITPQEFFSSAGAQFYGQENSYPTSYIPQGLRRPNTDGSCVHLATAVCLISIGEYQLAEDWLNNYSRGEYSSRHITRMESKGLLFAVETNGNPEFLDFWSGETKQVAKRVMGVSYTTMHVMNLLDLDLPGESNARAYLLNNQRRSGVKNWSSEFAWEVPREEFVRGWDHRGGWAFTILGTANKGVVPPNPPYPVI